jgi:hypothetical protein
MNKKSVLLIALVLCGMTAIANAGTEVIRDYSNEQPPAYNYAPPPPRPIYYAPPPPVAVVAYPRPVFFGFRVFHRHRPFFVHRVYRRY